MVPKGMVPSFGRSFANVHRLAHRLQRSDRSSATRASAELRLVLWRKVLCQFGRSWENTSLASPLDARTSAQSRLRGFNAASTHSSSAAPAVLAPTELFTCQVVGSSLVSSSMGFRYCHGSFCWDFRIVKVCVCGRGSAIARCFGRHSCSPALEASLIARIAAHTPFPTWTLRNSHLKTSNSPVRRFGGPELRQRQHIRRLGRLMTRCTLIIDGDSYCKASWVDSSWHPVGGLLALVFTGARPLTILLADTDFLLVDARCTFSSWTPFACLYHVT